MLVMSTTSKANLTNRISWDVWVLQKANVIQQLMKNLILGQIGVEKVVDMTFVFSLELMHKILCCIFINFQMVLIGLKDFQ